MNEIDMDVAHRFHATTAEPTATQRQGARDRLQSAMTRPSGHMRWSRIALRAVGMACVVALAAVLAFLFAAAPENEAAPSTPRTEALLGLLERAAASDPPPALPPSGSAWYIRSVSVTSPAFGRTIPVTHGDRTFDIASAHAESETWRMPDGTIRSRLRLSGWEPATASDRATWVAVGRPDLTTLAARRDGPVMEAVGRDMPTDLGRYQLMPGVIDLIGTAGRPEALAAQFRLASGLHADHGSTLFDQLQRLFWRDEDLPIAIRRTAVRAMLTEVDGVTVHDLGGSRWRLAFVAPSGERTELEFDVARAELLVRAVRIPEGNTMDFPPGMTRITYLERATVSGLEKRPSGARVPLPQLETPPPVEIPACPLSDSQCVDRPK